MIRRLVLFSPFAAGGVAAFVTLPFGWEGSTGAHVEALVAALLFAGVAAATTLAPWERLPRLLAAVPLVASFGVVALLRDAAGGAISGFGTLVLLPVFWLALNGSRLELVASFLAVAAVFVVPIALDLPHYPSEEWRRAILWLVVTPIVGLTTQTLVERLRESAGADPLTGLHNRRAWEEQLSLLLKLGERTAQPLSVALLDLDGFKAYNDMHGHLAGDRLLTRVATEWLAQVRTVDLLGRFGGDEFALLLPNAPLEHAVAVVARVVAATPDVYCSSGVVEWDRRESGEQLLARADRELYADKARQRSRGSAPVDPPPVSDG